MEGGLDWCLWGRYRINSNSPSGGMNDIVLSESNFPSFTHWWN